MIFRRKLYLQIYVTIILCMIMVVVAMGLFWLTFGHRHLKLEADDVIAKLISKSLPTASSTIEAQQEAVNQLSSDLGIQFYLYHQDNPKQIIGSPGLDKKPRTSGRFGGGKFRTPQGFINAIPLGDGRYIAIQINKRHRPPPLLRFITAIGVISLCILVGAYPFVRKLTRRLENLQEGVERMGSGDLSARVDEKGKDEVAKLARSFNKSAEKIEGLVNSQRLLLANASHELRTPLSRIRLGIELLEKDNSENRKKALNADIAELDELIDEILLMSRLDNSDDLQNPEEIDFLALIAEEASRYSELEIDGQSTVLTGDHKLLTRLVRNLLENAYKHGKPPVLISLKKIETDIILIVSDSGEGIKEELVDKVFDPFYREPDKQNIKGYGLGLALVERIAKAHNGIVEIVPKQEHPSAIKCVFHQA